jgi:uncharacterized protein (TIGR02145 family)
MNKVLILLNSTNNQKIERKILVSFLFLLFAVNGVYAQHRVMKIHKQGAVFAKYAVAKIDSVTFEEVDEIGVLINGVCWATRNVGAPGTFADTPESAGMFYQWNRKIGWSSENPRVNSNGSQLWDDENPSGTEWESENDPCPEGWRVPTFAERESLYNSESVFTTQNGVDGTVFGTAPDTIFMPATGYRDKSDGALKSVGSKECRYWLNERIGNSAAYCMYFKSGTLSVLSPSRTYGLPIRCVAVKLIQ